MIRNLFIITSLFAAIAGKSQCSVELAIKELYCFNGTNSLVASAAGQAPFHYVWSNGDHDSIADNLVPTAIYTVTVNDNMGCVATATAAISYYGGVPLLRHNASCPTCCDGYITFAQSPQQTLCVFSSFDWVGPNSNFTTDSINVTGLCAGSYSITGNSDCGCPWLYQLTINANPVGITDYSPAEDMNAIYPNPSAGKLNFAAGRFQKGDEVIIYSATGGELKRFVFDPAQEYSTEGLQNGIYLVKSWNGKQLVYAGKLVVAWK